ncbi:hypothetical protein PSTT_10774 [Puccinia striiformis]|uniref:Uncharacterized protein n=1 Tax=Puccinia striiformis TaxID=27350 RepID=A0A2S4V2Z9_9BASI|nr:hypothetical protein PSTT_10774 [Puccinia striiformis]
MMQFLQSMQESGEKCKMEKLLAYGSPAAMEGAETGKKRHRHRPINRLYEYILATVIKAGQKSIISNPSSSFKFQQKTIPTYQTLCFNWEVW